MELLYRKLEEYGRSDYYGFHMPGHKRNTGLLLNGLPYDIDITEIEGFDDLHHASGILQDAQKRAAEVYGAGQTFFLINGSTAGILAAVLGSTRKGDTVLVSRNCHKSVYHAIYMNELKPVYVYPGFHEEFQLNTEVSVSAVKAALKAHPEICAAVIVSPTYDGVVSDVEAISAAVHEHGIPLIVDEAHGAHFGFHPYFPQNSNQRGADVVVHSLHKTLPSLTQTALLHVNEGYADVHRIKRYVDMLQSSSPSYVLLAGIDACVHALFDGKEHLFEPYVGKLEHLRTKLLGLSRLRLIDLGNMDRSKLVISVKDTGMTSRELYRRLYADYHLQMEMVAGSYVLGMTSVGDTEEGYRRLQQALFEIDGEIGEEMQQKKIPFKEQEALPLVCLPEAERVYVSAKMDMLLEKAKLIPWEESEGGISAEYAYLYPPGSPLIVPGERITARVRDALLWYERQGFSIEGLSKEGYIKVFTNG